MRIHSNRAWDVASRYSHHLASETRDLAAWIDAAINEAFEQAANIAEDTNNFDTATSIRDLKHTTRDQDDLIVTHTCTSTMSKDFDSYGKEIPCTGQRHSDGTFTGGCGEPCRWMMIKCGEGEPPWTDEDRDSLKRI